MDYLNGRSLTGYPFKTKDTHHLHDRIIIKFKIAFNRILLYFIPRFEPSDMSPANGSILMTPLLHLLDNLVIGKYRKYNLTSAI